MDTFWQDLRDGGKALSRAAAIALVAALTLAIGVGASKAVCSEEERYAVQGKSVEAPGPHHGAHVRYMDYRDRSVPLLVW